MYGSTETNSLTTRTSPWPTAGSTTSTNRKSSGTGQPEGRRTSCHWRLTAGSAAEFIGAVFLRGEDAVSGCSSLGQQVEHAGGEVDDEGRGDDPHQGVDLAGLAPSHLEQDVADEARADADGDRERERHQSQR